MARSALQAQNIRDTGWVRVRSTNVARIRHIGAPVNELYVQFKDGGTYAYEGVDYRVWNRMKDAASKGKFVHRVLIKQGFAYRKL